MIYSTNVIHKECDVIVMSDTHALERLMSSRVAEAERYLKQGRNTLVNHSPDLREGPRPQSLACSSGLCNRVTLRSCVPKALPVPGWGGGGVSDACKVRGGLLKHQDVLCSI